MRSRLPAILATLLIGCTPLCAATAGATTSTKADVPSITVSNLPIVKSWWTLDGDLIDTIQVAAQKLQAALKEKRPSPSYEYALCQSLHGNEVVTAEAELDIERSAVDKDPKSTTSFWSSLQATVNYLDVAGTQCARYSSKKEVHFNGLARSDLKIGVSALNQVYRSLRANSVAPGVPSVTPTTSAPRRAKTKGSSPAHATTAVTAPGLKHITAAAVQRVFDESTLSVISWASSPLADGTPRLLGQSPPCTFEIIGQPPNNVVQADVSCVVAGASAAASGTETSVLQSLVRNYGDRADLKWLDGRDRAAKTPSSQITTTSASRTDGRFTFEIHTSTSAGTIKVILRPS